MTYLAIGLTTVLGLASSASLLAALVSLSLSEMNCEHLSTALGIWSICEYQNSWYTVSVVSSSRPVYMNSSSDLNTSAGTVGSSSLRGAAETAGARLIWVEKYPEQAERAALLQAMGVPDAVTMRSMDRSVTGDEEGQEVRLVWSMVTVTVAVSDWRC